MSLTTGQVADDAGVKKDTILYYEREGLIDEPPRTDNGYRQFPQDTVQTIRFIQEAQSLGFTLNEIESLLSLREGESVDCDDVQSMAREKHQSIENKIKKLEKMKETLDDLIEQCERNGTYEYCPIIESLQPEGQPS
jgi:MerR family copper efflux transcriptional regulator